MSDSHTPRSLGLRKSFVFALLACAVVAIAAANSAWLHVDTVSVLGQEIQVSSSGQSVSPGLTAAGLVAIAAALFLSISGRIGKYVALALALCSGVLMVVASVLVIKDPSGAIVTDFAEATGSDAVPDGVSIGPAAWVTVAVAIVLIGISLLGFIAARRWRTAGTKYDRAENSSEASASNGRPNDEIASDERGMWDSLTEGIDPSEK